MVLAAQTRAILARFGLESIFSPKLKVGHFNASFFEKRSIEKG
jgi:hypothetical protein